MDRKKSIFFFLFALHRTRATCTIPSKGGRPRFGARADKCQTTGSLRQGTAFGKGQPSARDSLRQGTAFFATEIGSMQKKGSLNTPFIFLHNNSNGKKYIRW